MGQSLDRRNFLKALAAAPLAASLKLDPRPGASPAAVGVGSGPRDLLEPFDYGGVRLLDGMLRTQYLATRDFYFGVADDDILKGFRKKAGLPAPGKELGGWCAEDSYMVFGQWLSGMARMFKATGDGAILDKALHLLREWEKTIAKPPKIGHYLYDKLVCGLVDLRVYAGRPEALPLLERVTDWAMKDLGRTRNNTSIEDHSADRHVDEGEWYTLSENLYRAYQATGESKFKAFGDVWRYPHYWGMFTGRTPLELKGKHAYSHVNSLSSAAMTYAVTGEPEYLEAIVNAFDHFQRTQCYATGGFGPGEMLMAEDGFLGLSIEDEPASFFGHWPHLYYDHGRSFETPCGSWAVFKLCRYLTQFTGEARFGDWVERLVYNGIGAALPMSGPGRTFYYSDYRLGGGSKVYYRAAYPCCAGTYIQAVTDYHNIIYYKDAAGLFVNLFIPSEVAWRQGGSEVKVVQTTSYPESEATTLEVRPVRRTRFALRLRVPGWTEGASLELNGERLPAICKPGTWATVERDWAQGDRLVFRIPMRLELKAVDARHPDIVAATYGPVVLVQSREAPSLDGPADLLESLEPGGKPLEFRSRWRTAGVFEPFYRAKYDLPYRMYFKI